MVLSLDWFWVLELQDALDGFKDFVGLIPVEILCVPPQLVSELFEVFLLPRNAKLFSPLMRLSLPLIVIIRRIRHGITVPRIRIHLLRWWWHLISIFIWPLHQVFRIRGRWRRRRRDVWFILSILILWWRCGVGPVRRRHGVVVRRIGWIGIWGIHGRVLSQGHVHGMRRVHIGWIVRIVRVLLIVIMRDFLLFGRMIVLLFISLYFPIFFQPVTVPLPLLKLPVLVPSLANPSTLPLTFILNLLLCGPSTTSITIWLELLDSCQQLLSICLTGG